MRIILDWESGASQWGEEDRLGFSVQADERGLFVGSFNTSWNVVQMERMVTCSSWLDQPEAFGMQLRCQPSLERY